MPPEHPDNGFDRLRAEIRERGVDERLERFRGETQGEFRRVDRRFLRLEARILRRS